MASQYAPTYASATLMTLAALGASVFPTIVRPPEKAVSGKMKIVTLGSGATVQILPMGVSGLNIAGATAVGASLIGYPLGTTEVFLINGPMAFYLANTTAASTVSICWEISGFGATFA